MRNALTLLIQHPALAKTIPQDFPVLTIGGGDFFGEVLAVLRDAPGLPTAALVERFRDHPYAESMGAFASTLHAAPVDGIDKEFQDSLQKLLKMQRALEIENLMARAAVAPGLSIEEKKQLQALIASQNPVNVV
jgi:DNA primase